ncbi:MAG: HEPN domain-containing protein [Desulfuromonadaceae bacterium]|nr:HEPN domain-containing protein [Desulfuromonadaceae bacterium]MDD5105413.1 HEPN domain-containing protein [Desulfuromonadaceae bacterium]
MPPPHCLPLCCRRQDCLGRCNLPDCWGRSPQSIVNRCYYAMFYATLALLQDIGKAPTKHSGIISLFDTEYVMKGIFPRELSKDLHKAFELRQSSDYKVRPTMSEEQVKEEIDKASRFVEAVKSYFQQSL